MTHQPYIAPAHTQVNYVRIFFSEYPAAVQHRLFETCIALAGNDGFPPHEALMHHSFTSTSNRKVPGFSFPLWCAYAGRAVAIRESLEQNQCQFMIQQPTPPQHGSHCDEHDAQPGQFGLNISTNGMIRIEAKPIIEACMPSTMINPNNIEWATRMMVAVAAEILSKCEAQHGVWVHVDESWLALMHQDG